MPLLRRDGTHFGTLCALDPEPADLSESHFDIFRLLARLIAHELEAHDDYQRLESDLTDAHALAQARERLIGVLSHDLRTPLTAVLIGSQQLARAPGLAENEQRVAMAVAGSARRATRMVADLLDFTRARLSGGIPVERAPADLSLIVSKVISEIRTGSVSASITTSVTGAVSGMWDADRVAQVASNLIHNALEHGLSDEVHVRLEGRPGDVVFEVENASRPLEQDELLRIFSPRTKPSSGRGLGLGLFIVQQIMRAHGGTVQILQDNGRFTAHTVWPRE